MALIGYVASKAYEVAGVLWREASTLAQIHIGELPNEDVLTTQLFDR